MHRGLLTSAFLVIWFASTSVVPAAEIGLDQNALLAQQTAAPATAQPANRATGRPPGNRPTAAPGRPTARPPGGGPGNRPTAAPGRPTARPPGGGPGNRPTARPPARPTPRPTARPPARPTPRPTANPWRPNRPPNVRPPNTGWQRPPWANHTRPSWARNHGWRQNYVLVNPRFTGGNWWWNRGSPWFVNNNYWGGGFWGPFGVFTLGVGVALWNQTRFNEPGWGSPGWWLFQTYGLTPARCGPHDLVYIFGPNNSVMCAFPNMYVPPGWYYVDPNTLQLFVM